MCLSTIRDAASEDHIIAEYVTNVRIDGDSLTFTDITGNEIKSRGNVTTIDLVKNIINVETY